MRFFHATKTSKQDTERIILCLSHIKRIVSEKCGVSKFIDLDDTTAAFAGSENDMQLMLEISLQKSRGKKYLYASVDDNVSWQEWDYNDITDFEEDIAKYISDRVNKTIKTVIKKDNNIVTTESYYLADSGEWISFESESIDSFFLSKIIKPTEIITSYHLD